MLAGLGDPLLVVGEALKWILAEQPGAAAAGIEFTHLLVQRAVDEDRALHGGVSCTSGLWAWWTASGAGTGWPQRWAGMNWSAAELEAAGREAAGRAGRQAAAWLR